VSLFDEAILAVDHTIDEVFGEYFSYRPMKEVPNVGMDADPDRLAVAQVYGVYTDEAMMIKGADPGPGYVSSVPRFSYLNEQIPFPVQKDDEFTRLVNGMVFAVSYSLPDGVDRTKVVCNQIGNVTVTP
jgi:hypothetical protein